MFERQNDLQLFTDGSCCFGGTGVLYSNDLHQIDDSAEIIFLVLLACQPIDLNSDGGIWLPLHKWLINKRTF